MSIYFSLGDSALEITSIREIGFHSVYSSLDFGSKVQNCLWDSGNIWCNLEVTGKNKAIIKHNSHGIRIILYINFFLRDDIKGMIQTREENTKSNGASRNPIKEMNKIHPKPDPNKLAKYNTLVAFENRIKDPPMANPAKKYGSINIV
jgi:hypothetical protein